MEQSSSDLDPFKNDEEFNKPKNLVKKEIDRVLKNLKPPNSLNSKSLLDWEKNEIFDLYSQKGRNRPRRR